MESKRLCRLRHAIAAVGQGTLDVLPFHAGETVLGFAESAEGFVCLHNLGRGQGRLRPRSSGHDP
jgi:hypothetical protein